MQWTKDDSINARARGWDLFTVVDVKKVKYLPMTLDQQSCMDLTSQLVEAARQRDALAIKALQTMATPFRGKE